MEYINDKGGKLTLLKPGARLNPNGRPKGAKNKANIARDIIELYFHPVFKKHPKYKELLERFPELEKIATNEELMTLIQVEKAIFQGDTNAYMAVINRARGTKPEGAADESKPIELPTEEITKLIQTHLSKKF